MGRELVLKWVVPDTVDKQLEDEIVRSAKEEVVVRLFKESEISSGYAAKLLGLAKRDFKGTGGKCYRRIRSVDVYKGNRGLFKVERHAKDHNRGGG
ncbi:UPF0175 family protein [Candidatus Magnetobacterium casense]|uniref:UPF0175 family protein n=1 Tax=Candidatus Magnetobacterium casense TaxID=1455061 RepID=A0ABS6S0W2_9BACT|nr:UPF0175 family protein [Candidatus Magnetobacterium casensis]MBV6342495.1 UPF0175 family protein [Candidatus Magnetobacterium casensis]